MTQATPLVRLPLWAVMAAGRSALSHERLCGAARPPGGG
jgi:hypothetical protein